MSAGIEPSQGGQDFDLNLAPIIDCFTVLITFMLASASFLAIGVFDANVATNGPAPAANGPPPSIRVDLELALSKEIALKVEGKMTLNKKIAALNGRYDGAALAAELKSLASKFPDTQGFVLGAADDVEYGDLIEMMEALKKQVPSLSVVLRGL